MNFRTIVFFTNPNQNPQNEKIRVFWVMILKNLPIKQRDVGMAILLLVYMPTLGVVAIVSRNASDCRHLDGNTTVV